MASNQNTAGAAIPNVDFYGGRALIPVSGRTERLHSPPRRRRTARACLACHHRKIKCTGEQPRCAVCVASESTCVYEQGPKDTVKQLREEKQSLITLLKDVSQRANEEDRRRIQGALQTLEERRREPYLSTSQNNLRAAVPATNINLPRDSAGNPRRETQFVSITTHEPNEVPWLQTLQREFEAQSLSTDIESNINDIFNAGDVQLDSSVDPYYKIPFERASELFDRYLATAHDWLPIVPGAFEEQFRTYYDLSHNVPNRWLAILNLIFAIGARSTRFAHDEHLRTSEEEETDYVSRAVKLLCADGDFLFTSDPDLPLVQVLVLLSFYYLAAGHADRAWAIVGAGLRCSIVLGLHLTSGDASVSALRRETLARAWWSLRSLECLLSSVTGRPCGIPNEHSNVPLPQSMAGDQSGGLSAHVLNINLKISIVTHEALSSLYSVRATFWSHQAHRDRIVKLKSELERQMPAILSLSSEHRNVLLRFNYFDAMMLITRPCLWSRRRGSHQDEEMPGADDGLAEDCVRAARGIVQLLSTETRDCIIQYGPWWCLVHYLVRAIVVLLLAMPAGAVAPTGSTADLVSSIRQLLDWLRWLRRADTAAERAFSVVLNTVRRSYSHVELGDLLEQEGTRLYGGPTPAPGRRQNDPDTYPQFEPQAGYFTRPAGAADDLFFVGDAWPVPPTYGMPLADSSQAGWDWD